MEKVYKEALQKADEIINEAKEIKKDAILSLQNAKNEAQKMAIQWLNSQEENISEKARKELLKSLVIYHLKKGKSVDKIIDWLQIDEDFILGIKIDLLEPTYAGNTTKIELLETSVLRYENLGRGGTIYFDNGEHQFSMWWEFGGRDVVAIVEIPTVEKWKERTGMHVGEMPEMINFIGSQIIKDQFLGVGYYKITDNALLFYKK